MINIFFISLFNVFLLDEVVCSSLSGLTDHLRIRIEIVLPLPGPKMEYQQCVTNKIAAGGSRSSQTKPTYAVRFFVCKPAATFVNSIKNQKHFLAWVWMTCEHCICALTYISQLAAFCPNWVIYHDIQKGLELKLHVVNKSYGKARTKSKPLCQLPAAVK